MNLNSMYRLPAIGMALVCVLFGGLLFAAGPASAALQYPLLGEISPASTPTGEFFEPVGVVFDSSSGDVIVDGYKEIDAFGSSSDEFEWFLNESNAPLGQEGFAGVAVNDGTGEIYVADNNAHRVAVFGSVREFLFEIDGMGGGKPVPKGLVEPEAVAVDQATGEVYVYDRSNEVIDVFTATGEYLFQIASAGGSGLGSSVTGLAVDGATGDLLVGDEGNGASVVYVLDAATGAYVATWSGADTPQKEFAGRLALAINVSGDVYVASSGVTEQSGGVQVETAPAVVDHLTATGEYESQIARIPGEASTLPAGSLHGVAVDPSSGDVYVLQECQQQGNYCPKPNHGVVDVFAGNPVAVPRVALAPLSSSKPTSVTLHGVLNPEETGVATCEFEYGTSPSYGQSVECVGPGSKATPVANGNAAVPVEVSLSGLQPDTTYYYRLDGTNLADGDTNTGEGSEDVGQFTTPGPGVRESSVVDVAATSVTFGATIDPNGGSTSYYFQYGTSSGYGLQAPAGSGEAIGSGETDVVSSVHVQGLAPSTVYHYRLVVVSEVAPGDLETIDGADHTFSTQAAGGGFVLADGRQWEMVSPANKLGALIEAPGLGSDFDVMQASAGGDAIAYRASSPTESEPAGGYGQSEIVFSTRGVGGWSSQDISLPHNQAPHTFGSVGQEFQIFSEDLSRAAVQPTESSFTPLSPAASESTAYLRSDYLNGNVSERCEASDKSATSCFTPLVTRANDTAGPFQPFGGEVDGNCEENRCGPLFQGASPDLSHLVLSSQVQLTSTPAPAGGPGLYEWSGGSLQLLDVLPVGEAGPAVLAGTATVLPGADALGVRGSVSDDGQRVVMEGGATGGQGLYLRDLPAGETLRLDVPQGGKGPSENAVYMDASSDASRVFFLDSGRLMAGSSQRGADLYEYNLNAPMGSRLSDLSVDSHARQSAHVAMVLGVSEDGSYLYFAAGGALAPGAGEGACPFARAQEQAGERGCNLYVRHEGVTRLIAVLPGEDFYDWSPPHSTGSVQVYARVSPNGRWLAFMSAAELTGHDTTDVSVPAHDTEVYLYDGETGRTSCASCNPTGARPTGVEIESPRPFEGQSVAASVPSWTNPRDGFGADSVHQPRYLSNSGRLFFDSVDALVPQDVDGVEDVYEYQPAGVPAGEHACSAASVSGSEVFEPARSFEFEGRTGEEGAGCVSLISSGTSSAPSSFLDASESGGDVFFRTEAQLVPQDYDTAYDVYDAHECTSAVPCLPVVTQPRPCDTEASCKPAPEPQPSVYGLPSSATFSGAGNLASGPASALPPKKVTKKTVKCRKGFVKNKKNKCVKQPKKKSKKAKKAKRATNDRRASR